MTVLLDGNVLIAAVVSDHIHHESADTWLGELREPFATCPITEGTLLRFLIRDGLAAVQALEVLASIHGLPGHVFWRDEIGFLDAGLDGVIGHRQVTDSYLLSLARHHQGRLATFDRGLALSDRRVVELLGGR